mmetsp:Transcript_48799/g.86928  ORF Transcript_48799/g.86928 Transcript_48799/m.86928 type:complete len:196 (-) Transcript_48799:759-1346(-)
MKTHNMIADLTPWYPSIVAPPHLPTPLLWPGKSSKKSIEHLIQYNGVFYVPIAVIIDESRGWIKASRLSKCAKARNVPSFSGQDIGGPTTKQASTGKPIGGQAGKYYILDGVLTLLSPEKAGAAKLFLTSNLTILLWIRTQVLAGSLQMRLHKFHRSPQKTCQRMLFAPSLPPSKHWTHNLSSHPPNVSQGDLGE